MTQPLRVAYELTLAPDEDPHDKARDIAYEQTVELPPEAVPDGPADWVPANVEGLRAVQAGVWRAVIAFHPSLAAGELTQTLNLVFGNISLKRGIRITAIEWPDELVNQLQGPAYGIDGWRALTGVSSRALAATALKPVGLSAHELASRAAAFARGGLDLIKDDHGITNQPQARFTDRVGRCRAAVGDHAIYLPNVTAAWPQMMERADLARREGCRAVLVSPMLTGFDAPRHIQEEFGLAVMAHPSLTGGTLQTEHGMTPPLLLGDVLRLAGADAVIYPNTGGRFGLTSRDCHGINQHLRGSLGLCRPAMPTPAGGIGLDQAQEWAGRYGRDTILLLGGSLYRNEALETAARRFIQALEGAA